MQLINASNWQEELHENISFYSTPSLQQISAKSVSTPAHIKSACAKHYGQWAWVSYNPQTGELLAGRDHFGLQPFYYYFENNTFIFASTIPAIFAKLLEIPAVNKARVEEYFSIKDGLYPQFSTQTYYQHIFRLAPAHILHVKNNRISQEPFWQLKLDEKNISLKNDDEYLRRFSELMHEAVAHCTQGTQKIACEFSGGLDSSAVLLTALQQNHRPELFNHKDTYSEFKTGEQVFSEAIVQQYQLNDKINYIDADSYDPLAALNYCSEKFAGFSPYLFFSQAHNIHQAVAQNQNKILLSGFGGDQCISSYASSNGYYPQLWRQDGFRALLHEHRKQYKAYQKKLPGNARLIWQLLRYYNSTTYNFFNNIGDLALLHPSKFLSKTIFTPMQLPLRPSMRHLEYANLQGDFCHEICMRVEYSAVIAQSLGFNYAYPMLYPPLVEFCFNLPIEQKRRNGLGRYLIRRYLEQFLPGKLHGRPKMTGHIAGATLKKCLEHMKHGQLKEAFTNLPYEEMLASNSHLELIQLATHSFAYMAKYYQQKNQILSSSTV